MLLLLMVAGVGASVFQHAPQLRRRAHRAEAVAHLDPRGLEAAVRRAGLRRVPEVARQARPSRSAFLTFAVSEAQHRLLLGMITQPTAFGLVIREIAIDILLALDLRHG